MLVITMGTVKYLKMCLLTQNISLNVSNASLVQIFIKSYEELDSNYIYDISS
jgi:hypothetical protein